MKDESGIDLSRMCAAAERTDLMTYKGKVSQVIGLVVESFGPSCPVGEICRINSEETGSTVDAEVVGFRHNMVLLMPLGEMQGISQGSEVVATGAPLQVKVGEGLLGRILNGLGEPIDGKGPIDEELTRSVVASPPNPLDRRRISEVLSLGIRAIDGLNTCGKGQRLGIFAGSGVGKSTILGMIARDTAADVNVIALVGERGREVKDFLERDLGEEGLTRSVVVVATSDQPALVRIKAPFVATTIAEYFRDRGKDVDLMMDSITRFAMAQREVGLAIGEPPATRGYTPSVFSILPKLLERSGTSSVGSITGLYTILVESDDMNEPIADTCRSILDGHITLSRALAERNHYPAIDILASVSRLMPDVVSGEHVEAGRLFREVLATYRDAEDLVNIGAYVSGSNPRIDHAISMIDSLNGYLRQGIFEECGYEECLSGLLALFPPPGSEGQAL